MKQYAPRGKDILVGEFDNTDDAKIFIQEKLAEDARLKVKALYRLMEGMDVLEEFTEVAGGINDSTESSSSSSSGAGQRSSFQPTPFNTAPRPAGLPHSWVKDEDNKEDDKK